MNIIVATALLAVRTSEEKERIQWFLPVSEQLMEACIPASAKTLFEVLSAEIAKVEAHVNTGTCEEVKAWLANVRVPFNLRDDQLEDIQAYCAPSLTGIAAATDSPSCGCSTFWVDLISIFNREMNDTLDKMPRRQPMMWELDADDPLRIAYSPCFFKVAKSGRYDVMMN